MSKKKRNTTGPYKMKYALTFLIQICILSLVFAQSEGKQIPTLISYQTINPVVIDAQPDEPDWASAKSIELTDRSGESSNSMSIQTLWDEENLYLLFTVEDKNLKAIQKTKDHPALYKDDMVEFLIDARNEKVDCWNSDDTIYHINILSQKKDDRGTDCCESDAEWDGDASYAVSLNGTLNDRSDTDEGYIVEVAISWAEIGITPVEDLSVGFNFANGDNGILFDWVGASPFRSPDVFGNLILGRK